jgi:hypothetical protein
MEHAGVRAAQQTLSQIVGMGTLPAAQDIDTRQSHNAAATKRVAVFFDILSFSSIK